MRLAPCILPATNDTKKKPSKNFRQQSHTEHTVRRRPLGSVIWSALSARLYLSFILSATLLAVCIFEREKIQTIQSSKRLPHRSRPPNRTPSITRITSTTTASPKSPSQHPQSRTCHRSNRRVQFGVVGIVALHDEVDRVQASAHFDSIGQTLRLLERRTRLTNAVQNTHSRELQN